MRFTSLISRLVAAALLVTALASCSGDDSSAISTTTRVTEDPKVVAKERMCEALEVYAPIEKRRPTGPIEDASRAERMEQNRLQVLANLESTLTPDAPASVGQALTQLKGIPIVAQPTTTTAADGSTTPAQAPWLDVLKVVTDGLDPICGTEGGETPTTTSTTSAASTSTASGAPSTTTAPAPAGSGGATSSTSASTSTASAASNT